MHRKESIPYIRVGTKYYKIISVPDIKGKTFEQKIVLWSKDNLITDYKKVYIRRIPKYDSFVTLPDHINYRSVIGNCYNLYHPLPYKPEPGDIPKTKAFLAHIFGDQLELGYDYLALLYFRPTEILPVLSLVSRERDTGKSTFVKWLKLIFGHNMTLNTNDEFKSRFNSDWTSKILIAVEETLLDRKEESEKIKNLSTANVVKTESKGLDKVETQFFGKLILCSNNETNFVHITEEEIRYWVRKISPIENSDPLMEDKLKDEIPAFLHFLIHRGIKSERKSRMWFAPEDIYTEALQRLKDENASIVEKEIKEIITDLLITYKLDEVCFTRGDLIDHLKYGGIRQLNQSYVTNILQQKWGISQVKNPSTYSYYTVGSPLEDGQPFIKKKGRYYVFKREKFLDNSYISSLN